VVGVAGRHKDRHSSKPLPSPRHCALTTAPGTCAKATRTSASLIEFMRVPAQLISGQFKHNAKCIGTRKSACGKS
jgi:hypothetical protein